MGNDNKKKVAIATFHSAHNYGAVLQTYALYKTIEQMKRDVYLIDYSPKNIIKSYSLFPRVKYCDNTVHYIKSWVSLILDFKRRYTRYKGFEEFLKDNFKYLKNTKSSLDTIVVGSDQIWNPTITGDFDKNFFGFVDNVISNNVFSYAASMGISSLDSKNETQFIPLLDNLSAIGVREYELKEYILKLTGKNATVNLDPTLLLNKDDWSPITATLDKKEDYLLVYEVKEHSETFHFAKHIADLYKLKIIVITAKTSYKISKNFEADKSPGEFLALFRDASFVITTSFHGTVFSIINEKDFFTLAFGTDTDIRSKFLLSQLGLYERFVSKLSDINSLDIDYDKKKVKEKLERLRANSLAYISESLGD